MNSKLVLIIVGFVSLMSVGCFKTQVHRPGGWQLAFDAKTGSCRESAEPIDQLACLKHIGAQGIAKPDESGPVLLPPQKAAQPGFGPFFPGRAEGYVQTQRTCGQDPVRTMQFRHRESGFVEIGADDAAFFCRQGVHFVQMLVEDVKGGPTRVAWVFPSRFRVSVEFLDTGVHQLAFNAFNYRGPALPAQRYKTASGTVQVPDPHGRGLEQDLSALLHPLH